MSSILSSLFSIFFLFLSMHACEARYIGLGPKGFGAPFLPFGKGLLLLEKFKTLGMDSSKGFVMKEYDAAEKGHGGAITSTTTPVKEVKCTSRGHKSGMEPAGSEIVESSDHHMVGLLKTTSPTTKKEARRRALSGKEAVNYNSDDKVEDNVVHTDYNPPHSTPPIHNRKS
ncbi:hypothetical protein ACFX13_042496 [Malus domestica]|nr:uncharacterized protein LOC103439636 [Malus domestica]